MTTTSSVPALDTGSKLAVIRTRLAHDRTLMAWVRTATSLISFGFTIYKFFQYLQDSKIGFAGAGLLGPRGFAIAMIGVGLGSLALATFEHRQSMRSMREDYGLDVVPYSMTTLVAGVVVLLGIFALIAVIMKQ